VAAIPAVEGHPDSDSSGRAARWSAQSSPPASDRATMQTAPAPPGLWCTRCA
jgi:hypothetical protein